jgi:azurin
MNININRNLFTAAAVSFVMVLGACGDSGEKKKSEDGKAPVPVVVEKEEIEVTVLAVGNTMMEMMYDPKEIRVPANSKIKIQLINKGTDGAMLHNIVFIPYGIAKEVAEAGIARAETNYVDPNDNRVIAASKVANPGETVKFEFDSPPPGTYQYICTYPGHWQQMQGKLIVE